MKTANKIIEIKSKEQYLAKDFIYRIRQSTRKKNSNPNHWRITKPGLVLVKGVKLFFCLTKI